MQEERQEDQVQEEQEEQQGQREEQQEERRFTQADLDRIVAERLARERKAAEEKVKAEAEKAKLATEERLKLERKEAEEAKEAAEERARLAGWRADLKGEVRDVGAALKLIDPEKHLDADGNVSLKALLKDYPFLAPVDRVTPGGGGAQEKQAATPSNILEAVEADRAAGLRP